MSELPQGRRRSQRRAPKNKSFVPKTETTSESKFQVQEENEQDLQVEEPTGDNVPRHESSVLVTKDETVVPSERNMLSKPKDRLRRSRRKAHENKSFAPPNRSGDTDDSCGGNKLGEQLELDEPVLEEDISLPKASGMNDEEEHWHKKSEDIVDDKENTGSHSSKFSNLVNADVREQNFGKVVLTEEKESAVAMVENLSLNKVSDRDKETTKHADALVEKLVDEDGGEAASMMLKEPLEVPGTSEVSEDCNTCDTALLKFKAYIPTNSVDEANVATNEGNFARENDTDFIDATYSGYLETVLEEQDCLNCRVSPVHGLGNAVSDECAFNDDELRTSHHFDQVEANAYEVESEKRILSFNEPVKQTLLEEAGEVVPERINYHGTPIWQSNHRENRKYREIPVIQQHVQIDCCVIDREVEEYESFVCEEAIVEHEEADKLFKSLCEPVLDHAEACEDGNLNEIGSVLQDDGNAISKNVTECTGFNTKTNYETTEICQVDPEANERTENVLDKYEEHQVNLQMTDNKTMVEAEEFIETIEDELKISELGKQKKDGADALLEELGKEGGGEATSMTAKESEFPGTCQISEDGSICGAPLLVSQVHYPCNEENVTNVSAISENKEGLAEKGKNPGPLQQIVPKELVDLTGGPPLWHGHVNAVSGELIVEENRSLEDKAATKENFDCKGGKSVADSEDNARISKQIVLVEPIDHGYQRERETLEEASKLFSDDIPFQVLIPIEQYNHLDNERNKEFSVSQHSAPTCCSLNIEDKGFNCREDLAKCKDSDGFVNTTYEPSLDHLPPKNGNSDETCDVLEYDGSGIFKNALGDRDIKDSECTVETNDIWKVILDADDNTAVNAAESYLVHQVVKEVDNNIEIHKEADNDIEGVNEAGNNNMGECTATAEAECWHKDSEVLNENENAERCVSKLENVMQVPHTSEESSKSRVSKNEDLMEAKIYQMEKGVCFTDPEDEENKGNKVMYDPEPNGFDEEFSVLQQTHEISQAGLLTIKDTGLHSPVNIIASSSSSGRNLDQSNLYFTASTISSRESQEVLRGTVTSELEDDEEASGATTTIHSVKRNFRCVDLLEDAQLMENLELGSLGEFSEAKGENHAVEKNVEAMKLNCESKHAEQTMEDKLEARASGAVEEVKANVEAFSINFDGYNDEQEASVCAIFDELISKEAEHQWKAAIGSKLDREVIEVEAIVAAEGIASTSSQVSPQELVDHENYDDKAPDAISVAATLRELSAECNEIAENNSNGQTVEGNSDCTDPENVVLEEETSFV